MFAVIPAYNEAQRISRAIQTVERAGCKRVIVVANGCTDDTEQVVKQLITRNSSIQLVSLPDRLGVDVPRAIGAIHALKQGASYILFYDGDLVGQIEDPLASLLHTATSFKLDLAMCDCYGTNHSNNTDDLLLYIREGITRELGLFRKIGYSNPAHGPCVVSARLLARVPIAEVAQPPVLLAYAGLHHMRVDSPIHISHARLGSAFKDSEHTKKIRDTIIGDCIEALHVLQGTTRTRTFGGVTFDGYHSQRRFDAIDEVLQAFVRQKRPRS